jgi:hypothetical protein
MEIGPMNDGSEAAARSSFSRAMSVDVRWSGSGWSATGTNCAGARKEDWAFEGEDRDVSVELDDGDEARGREVCRYGDSSDQLMSTDIAASGLERTNGPEGRYAQ